MEILDVATVPAPPRAPVALLETSDRERRTAITVDAAILRPCLTAPPPRCSRPDIPRRATSLRRVSVPPHIDAAGAQEHERRRRAARRRGLVAVGLLAALVASSLRS